MGKKAWSGAWSGAPGRGAQQRRPPTHLPPLRSLLLPAFASFLLALECTGTSEKRLLCPARVPSAPGASPTSGQLHRQAVEKRASRGRLNATCCRRWLGGARRPGRGRCGDGGHRLDPRAARVPSAPGASPTSGQLHRQAVEKRASRGRLNATCCRRWLGGARRPGRGWRSDGGQVRDEPKSFTSTAYKAAAP